MERRSRVLSWVVFVAVVASILIVATSYARASGSTKAYSNGYEYTVSDGKATITRYTGTETMLSIPSSLGGYPVVVIGGYAFESNDYLTSVTIPNGVISIGDLAFQCCDSLISITLPNSLKNIGCMTFHSCDSLAHITIPNGVTKIDGVFQYCKSLVNIGIPDSVIEIGSGTFNGCSSLSSITIPNNVKKIGLAAFKGCSSLTEITIPGSVTAIDQHTFASCTKLISVTIPNSVTNIPHSAFKSCTSLKSITIPSSVTIIERDAFIDCKSLANISIQNGVQSIKAYAFSGCESLTSITIPDSVAKIEECVFADCRTLTDISVGAGNTAYASQNGVLFNKNKSKLITYPAGKSGSSYSIPSGVTDFEEHAFHNCANLSNIMIPDSVTTIERDVFYGCSGLTSITIPNGVSSIDAVAFHFCDNLSNIEVASGNTEYASQNGVLFNKSKTTLIIYPLGKTADSYFVPSGVTEIDGYAFLDSKLVSVTLPDGVISISWGAFQNCKRLRSITIPRSVTSISVWAFAYCGYVTIHGYVGSYAQTYAEEECMQFVAIDWEPLVITDVTCNKTSATVGDSSTWTIAATGGRAPLSYCFYVYQGSTVIYKGSYSASNTFTYTFPSAGSYKVQGYVRDNVGTKVSGYSAVIDVAAPVPLSITGITCNKTGVVVGDSATWTINAAGGQAPLAYCFYVYRDGVAVCKGSYTASNIYTYTFPSVGSYKVLGYVKDTINAKVTKYSEVINVIPVPLAIASVTCSKTSAVVGESATYTINATGGQAPLSYCFYVFKDGVAVYKGSYSASNTYTYTFTSSGSYKVQGYVRDNAGMKVSKYSAVINVTASASLAITSVTCNKASVAIGESATYTINATGGKAPRSYCFYVYKDGVAVHKGVYGTSNKYTYTFTSFGSYKVQGHVKDANNAKVSKYSAVINVTASASLIITSVTCNKSSVANGESATYTINATGGKAPRSYCFYVYKDGVAVHKGVYGTSNKYTYTFTSFGSYKVQGYVKDANNAKVSKYSAAINVTALAPLAITSVTCNKTGAVAGESATYTINATGGKAPLIYCFYVYKNGVAVHKGSYGASNTYAYTFQSAGNYRVQGYVKDADGAKVNKYSSAINVTGP